MSSTILVDMDGVLSNFVRGACVAVGCQHLWPKAEQFQSYDTWEVLGVDRQIFWDRIEHQGSEFWETLDPLPWMPDLLDLLRRFGKLRVASDATAHGQLPFPDCAFGKSLWLKRHVPFLAKNPLLLHEKHWLSRPGVILVDDSDEQVRNFQSVSDAGKAVLFPQPWNSARDHIHRRLEYVEEQLQRIHQERLA